MSEVNKSSWKMSTKAIHVGQEPDAQSGATVPPIHISSTFTQQSPGVHKGYEYARSGNPTRDNLEACLAALEGGSDCASFASGSAATAAVFATLSPGDKVLAYADVYGGTFRLLKQVFEGFGLIPVFTDDVSPEAFAKLIDNKTKLVWLETPTNPLLRCLDIGAIARTAHEAGAKLAVDNTFATPAIQIPIELGADYTVHSTTKYLGGHSDVVGGAVITKNNALMERIRFLQNALGGVSGPFDCYLQQRGLKTLTLRMERHSENAMTIAKHLQGHPKLANVFYPFLEDHPDYALAKRIMKSGGGIVTIVFSGQSSAAGSTGNKSADPAGCAAIRFAENLHVFALAESLGGVESLCNHPAIMTHASIPKEIREARGITDGLLRLSVGIENVEDLIADLEQALDKA